MPPVLIAEDAVTIAESFLRKYHPFFVLKKVRQQKDEWLTEFDVSILGPSKIVRISLDAETGGVIVYETE